MDMTDPNKAATAFAWVFDKAEPAQNLPFWIYLALILLLMLAFIYKERITLGLKYAWERIDDKFFKGRRLMKAENNRIRDLLGQDIATAFEDRVDKGEITEEQVQKIYAELVQSFPIFRHALDKKVVAPIEEAPPKRKLLWPSAKEKETLPSSPTLRGIFQRFKPV